MGRLVIDYFIPILGVLVVLHTILIIIYIRSQQYGFALAVSIVILVLLWVMYRAIGNQQSLF